MVQEGRSFVFRRGWAEASCAPRAANSCLSPCPLALDNPAYSVRLLPVPASVGDTGSLVIYLPLAGLV